MADLPPQLQAVVRQAIEAIPFSSLQEQVDSMLPAYRGVDAQPPVIDTEEKAVAYLTYRFPGTFAAISSVLDQLAGTVPTLAPATLVDIGGGSGAAAWAAVAAFPSLERVTILDRSQAALDVGARLASAGPKAMADAEWRQHRIGPPLPVGNLAIAAYLLGELTVAERTDLVDRMSAASTVAVVEPGTPAGYRRVIEARDRLIEAGMAIAAPCPHELVCPLLADDWCHFSVRFARSPELRRLKRAEHGHEDEKFSYVVATRLPVRRPGARVIRHPQYRGKMVTLELCRADGTAGETVVPKSRGEDYRQARKVRWGDSWR
ncbi:MAG TPA: small ribosomal subunit Rsm22 family protein [Acidimicrobiia bacterium]|nr:small ribosomal subunit Rsm22 family protein [Acidimicrobiia bacterium]